MKTKKLKEGEFLQVMGRKSQGLTPRGRIMRVPIDQICEFHHPSTYYNIRLEHVSGPLKGVHLQFSMVRAKQAKINNVCVCDAYDYPHRPGAGKCQTKS